VLHAFHPDIEKGGLVVPELPGVPEVPGAAQIEEGPGESDGRRVVGLSMRGKVALCGLAYFSLILVSLLLSSSAGIDYLQTTSSLEEAQAWWGARPFHLAFMDASVYPRGEADPSNPIPQDTAHIPIQLYEEILPEIEEVGGILAREVLASFCKIKPEEGNDFLPVDHYMNLTGLDPEYLQIFLNATPSLSLAPCPSCNGSGCPECNWTGEWGTYPSEGGITLPESMMEAGRLELYYDQNNQAWKGTRVTAYYDLEGKLSPGNEGYLDQYTSSLGSATPPPSGVELEVVGVTRQRAPTGLICLQDAWTLKGLEADPTVSFLYLRVPDITDFGKLNNEVSRHLSDYELYILYPPLGSPPPETGLPPLPCALSTATITMIVVVLALFPGSRLPGGEGHARMRHLALLGVFLFIAGGSSFLLITHSGWIQRSTVAQVLNLVAWLVALTGLFSAIVSGLVHVLSRRRIREQE
jgi:hypothetical protein